MYCMVKSRADAPRRAKAQRATEPRDDTQRIAEMIDLATETKRLADNLGEKFLSYLLAMAVQEMSDIDRRRSAKQNARRKQDKDVETPTAD